MDILHLVDRLEELLNESKPVRFSKKVRVDEDLVFEIIDQMRISVPDEWEKARTVLNEQDRTRAEAQEGANRTLKLADKQAEKRVSRDTIVELAEERAEEILGQAGNKAADIRQGADDYRNTVLESIEEELVQLLTQTRAGKSRLTVERQAPENPEEPTEILQG